MNETTKQKVLSAFWVFVSAFLLSLAVAFETSIEVSWSLSFWTPLLMTALRTGVKELVLKFAPVSLGGKK